MCWVFGGAPARPILSRCCGRSVPVSWSPTAMQPVDAPDYFYDPNWNEDARFAEWRRVLEETKRLPPLLAAAIAWDAWLMLEPDQRGAWRAPLIAALVLKARAKTRHVLLPLDTGRRFGKVPPASQPRSGRPLGRVSGVGADRCRAEHQGPGHTDVGCRDAAVEAEGQATEFAVAGLGRPAAVASAGVGADGGQGSAVLEPSRGGDAAVARLHPARTDGPWAISGVGDRVILDRVRCRRLTCRGKWCGITWLDARK